MSQDCDAAQERIAWLEDAVLQMQEMLVQLSVKVATLEACTSQHTSTPSVSPESHHFQPAVPADFDGDRTKGRNFWNACSLYISMCPTKLPSVMTRVNWILSLMKSGRAATFATHITEKVSAGDVPYTTFKRFEQEFKEKFFPRNEKVNALNKLESDTYHQGQRTVEEYTEAFKELVDEAGYPLDNAVTVRRYRKGLNLHIQDSVATQKIPPGEDDLEGWYDAACRFDNSRLVNEAFMSTSGPIVATPSTPERPVTCDHCGKMGHLTAQCSGLQDIESLVEEVVQQSIRQIKKGADTIRHKVKTPTLKQEIGPGYGKKKEGFPRTQHCCCVTTGLHPCVCSQSRMSANKMKPCPNTPSPLHHQLQREQGAPSGSDDSH